MKDIQLNNKNIIISSNLSDNFLKEKLKNPLLNFKLFDYDDVITNLTFQFDDKSLLYLYRKGYSFNNAEEILKNIKLIKNNISNKLDELVNLRNELIEQGLFESNEKYKVLLRCRNVLLLDKYQYDSTLLNLLKTNNIDYDFLPNDIIPHKIKLFYFDKIEDEIRYFYEMIYELFLDGVELNKIKLCVKNSTYLKILKKYQSINEIKINFKSELVYFNSQEYKDFISMFNTFCLEDNLKRLYENSVNKNAVKTMINRYVDVKDYINDDEIIPYFNYIAKKIKCESVEYENGIDIIDLEEAKDDDYVFLLGFEQNSFPGSFKDDDFLSNEEKISLSISDSNEERKLCEYVLRNNLFRLKNLFLSFSHFNEKEEFYLPTFLDNDYIEKIEYVFKNKIYSKGYYDLIMGKVFDDYHNFSTPSPFINSCKELDIHYKEYNHKYSKVDVKFKLPLQLSYSSINTYYECSYRFYLNYIIKANEFENNLAATIGNICHKMLENNVNGISTSLEDLLNEYDLKCSEKNIILNLKDPINIALDEFNEFKTRTELNNFIAEEISTYHIDEKSYLLGKIDLICFNDENYIIVDHKTSSFKFKAKEIDYGFSMQLPIYYLMLLNSKFEKKNLLGIYIKNIINSDFLNHDYSYLLLNGLTFEETSFGVINGSGNFVNRKKRNPVFSREEFDKIIEKTKFNIKEASNKILNCEFDINPKILKNKNISCSYCPFNDVCYKDYDDYVYLKDEEEEDAL